MCVCVHVLRQYICEGAYVSVMRMRISVHVLDMRMHECVRYSFARKRVKSTFVVHKCVCVDICLCGRVYVSTCHVYNIHVCL